MTSVTGLTNYDEPACETFLQARNSRRQILPAWTADTVVTLVRGHFQRRAVALDWALPNLHNQMEHTHDF